MLAARVGHRGPVEGHAAPGQRPGRVLADEDLGVGEERLAAPEAHGVGPRRPEPDAGARGLRRERREELGRRRGHGRVALHLEGQPGVRRVAAALEAAAGEELVGRVRVAGAELGREARHEAVRGPEPLDHSWSRCRPR